MTKQLQGVRVAVLAADGFEQAEVMLPMRALRRAGADVRVISLRPGRIRGMNFLWRGRKLAVDDTVANARAEDYGALLLPGGFVNPDLLRQSEQARSFVRRMEELGRPIAVICHGPELLISSGLVRGRRLTSWHGIADDVRNAGGIWVDDELVRDGTWVSSRGPQDLRPFVKGMLALFGQHAVPAVTKLQRRVHWVAQLSRVGTVAALGGAALGVRALARKARALPAVRADHRRSTTTDVLRDLGLATAFGGMLFGKLALDPATKELPRAEERAWMMIAPWRRYLIPGGLGLALASASWMMSRRRLRGRPGLRLTADLLLGVGVVTGVANAVCAEMLARRTRSDVTHAGLSLVPEPRTTPKQLVRAGRLTGLAHAGALGAMIGTTAALRARP
jgi:protease I